MARLDRAVLLNPGMRYLRRIGGLSEAMAGLAGVEPQALASEAGFNAAARAIRAEGEVAPDGANVRLRVERVRNPVAPRAMKALERLRVHAFRSGYDVAGLDDLVARWKGDPAVGERLKRLMDGATGVGNATTPEAFSARLHVGLAANAAALTGTPLSAIPDVAALDEAMARAHALEPRTMGPKAKPRFRYALEGGPEEAALAARAIATRVETFQGRLPATVVDAHAVEVERVGRAAGVARVKPYRWATDAREDAATASLARLQTETYGWTFHEAPERADRKAAMVRVARVAREEPEGGPGGATEGGPGGATTGRGWASRAWALASGRRDRGRTRRSAQTTCCGEASRGDRPTRRTRPTTATWRGRRTPTG